MTNICLEQHYVSMSACFKFKWIHFNKLNRPPNTRNTIHQTGLTFQITKKTQLTESKPWLWSGTEIWWGVLILTLHELKLSSNSGVHELRCYFISIPKCLDTCFTVWLKTLINKCYTFEDTLRFDNTHIKQHLKYLYYMVVARILMNIVACRIYIILYKLASAMSILWGTIYYIHQRL